MWILGYTAIGHVFYCGILVVNLLLVKNLHLPNMKLWIENNIIKNKEISFFILSVLALYVTSLLFYWGLGDLFRINRTGPDVLFVLIPYWFVASKWKWSILIPIWAFSVYAEVNIIYYRFFY